jgi:surface antigen
MWNHYRMRAGLIGAGVAAVLSACAPMGGPGPIFFPGQPQLTGLDHGSSLKASLSDDDRQGMSQATIQLLAGGQTNASQAWQTRNGDTGTVRIGSPVLVGLDSLSGAPVPAPADIDTSTALEAASGNYTASKTLNVRLGPSTAAPVAQALSAGTLVRAYAKTGEWLLIGSADQVYGYAFAQLLTAQGGGEPVLAGGKARRPRLCREVSLQVALAGGQRDLWSALVCKRDDGKWEVPAERGLS